MMSLEEAINHAENTARACNMRSGEESRCAEEHRQLAEWLRELRDRRNMDIESTAR